MFAVLSVTVTLFIYTDIQFIYNISTETSFKIFNPEKTLSEKLLPNMTYETLIFKVLLFKTFIVQTENHGRTQKGKGRATALPSP